MKQEVKAEQVEFPKISEICDIKKGKKVNSTKEKTSNSIPYLLIDTLRGMEPEYFTEDKKYTEAVPEDILIVADGANSGLVGTGVKGAVGSTILRIRINVDDLDKDYLSYFLKSKFQEFNTDMKGTGIPHLKAKKMLGLEIRKPSLEEQELIVQEIEKQLTRLDAAVAALRKFKKRFEIYRKAVLKKAFNGKLIKLGDGRDVNQLLLKIGIDRKRFWEEKMNEKFKSKGITPKNNNWKNKYKPPRELKSKETYELPAGWAWTNFESICSFEPNALKAGPFGSSLKKEFYTKTGYKIYGQEQVIRSDINYGDYYIDEERYNKLSSCSIKTGDLLISLVGTIGKILVVPEKFEKGIINPRLVKVSPYLKEVSPDYLKYYLISPLALSIFSKESHGQTMKILNLTLLKELPIPFTARENQEQIVQEIESKFSIIDNIEKIVDESLLKAERMRKSILKSAFEGKLLKEVTV